MIQGPNSVILLAALTEINAVDAGGAAQPELIDLALDTENEILDLWNAERGKVFADAFLPFTITANLNPHRIGPAAVGTQWATTQAPVSIEGIQVELNGTPVPFVYVKKRDAAWWQSRPSPQVTANFPTDFYYDPTWTGSVTPYGQVYFWPVPTQAYNVQLWVRMILAQLLANTVISLPPGYRRALKMSIAKALAPVLRKPWTPAQDEATRIAIAKIEANNTVVPQIRTADAGMPGSSSSGLPNFDWNTGLIK